MNYSIKNQFNFTAESSWIIASIAVLLLFQAALMAGLRPVSLVSHVTGGENLPASGLPQAFGCYDYICPESQPPPPPVEDHLDPARVLIVFNLNSTDSVSVGQYYRAKRNIPTSNVCGVDAAVSASTDWEGFESIRSEVLDCLDAVGNQIYYIVTTYDIPYKVNVDGSGYIGDLYNHELSLDSMLAIPHELPNFPFINKQAQSQVVPNPYYAGGSRYYKTNDIVNHKEVFDGSFDFKDAPIYLVTRLDGPTPEIAKGLVDKSIAAEQAGASGTACLDMVYDELPASTELNHDVRRSWFTFGSLGIERVLDQTNQVIGNVGAEVAACDDIMFYAGTYNNEGYFANALDWQTGSVANALHSVNAKTLRLSGAVSGPSVPQEQWLAAALNDGLTAGLASVAEPGGGVLARSGVFYHYWLQGYNLASAAYAATPYLFFTTTVIGDPLYHLEIDLGSCQDNDHDQFGTCGYPFDCNDNDKNSHPPNSEDSELEFIYKFSADENNDGVLDYDLDGDGRYRCESGYPCCDDCNDLAPTTVTGPQWCSVGLCYKTNVDNVHQLIGGWQAEAEDWYWLTLNIDEDLELEEFWHEGNTNWFNYEEVEDSCQDLDFPIIKTLEAISEPSFTGPIYLLNDLQNSIPTIHACRDLIDGGAVLSKYVDYFRGLEGADTEACQQIPVASPF